MKLNSLCVYCRKAKNCFLLKDITNELAHTIGKFAVEKNVNLEFIVDKCPQFIPNNHGREVEHICYSCINADTCKLWDQVCNIDEDFIREVFDYEIGLQEVCSTVSRCKFYKPKNR